jgi:hypothetical protein
MKTLLLFLEAVLFFNATVAQECGECSKPSIAIFDFEMKVARPDSASDIIEWMNLFYTGANSRYLTKQNEPNKDCIRWLDGAMINADLIQNGTLKFGATYTNLPSPGSFASADYILWGNIEKNATDYTATLILETGQSRENVKTVTTTFTNVGNNAFNAGATLSSQFGSILQVIRDFEVYKRDNDNMVAIKDLTYRGNADVITLTPEKTTVNAGDSVNIEIALTDCDGVALKNRTLQLQQFTFEQNDMPGSENGKFSVGEIVTDDGGKATVIFIPSAPGVAIARAGLPHYKPCGRWAVFFGEAALNVTKETMKFDAIWKYTLSTTGDTNWVKTIESTTFNFDSHTREYENAEFHIKGLLERNYAIPIVKSYDIVRLVSCSGMYAYSEDFHKDYTIVTPAITSPNIVIENHKHGGRAINLDAKISINPLKKEYPEVHVWGDIHRKGNDHYQYYNLDQGWTSDDIPVDDLSLGFSMNFTNSNLSDKKVEVSGETYKYSYTTTVKELNSNTVSDYHGHSLYTEATEEWDITISPYGSTTGVDEFSDDLPKSFSLEQNFPNPFNPVTSIDYNIAESSPVNIKVYNVLGSEVCTLVNEFQSAGTYRIPFDASSLSSGIYFYKISAGRFSAGKKMVLLK